MRRRTVLAVAPGAAALLAGCATPQPAPGLTSLAEGRWLVLGPTSDFDPQILPSGWSRIGRQGGDFARRIEAGRFILSLGAPGGDMILRALDIPLEQAPSLSWHWKLERAAFGGDAGDGAPRGLRLLLGFDTTAAAPGFGLAWPGRSALWPAHRRRIELAFGAIGAARADLAMAEFTVSPADGMKIPLRRAAADLTGVWVAERVDLVALYRGLFPPDRVATARIVFLAIGALPARLPPGVPAEIGHVAEVQLSR